MKKSVCVVLLLLSSILFVNLISAVPITVKTVKGHDVTITIYPAGSSTVLEMKKFPLIENDTIKYEYNGNTETIRIIVFVSIFGKKLVSEVFDDLSTNDEIILEVYPDNYVAPEEEVTDNKVNSEKLVQVSNNTELVVDENDTVQVDPSLVLDDTKVPNEDINLEKISGTGLVTDSNKSGFKISNMVYYIVGGVLICAILFFFVMKMSARRKPIYDDYEEPKEQIKIRKLSEIKNESKNTGAIRKEIEEAEDRLRKAQAQLNAIKNQDKIKEAEERLERDRRELESLRRGRR